MHFPRQDTLIHVGLPRAGSKFLQNNFRQSPFFASYGYSNYGSSMKPSPIVRLRSRYARVNPVNFSHIQFMNLLRSPSFDYDKLHSYLYQLSIHEHNLNCPLRVISNEGLCRNIQISYLDCLSRLKLYFLRQNVFLFAGILLIGLYRFTSV